VDFPESPTGSLKFLRLAKAISCKYIIYLRIPFIENRRKYFSISKAMTCESRHKLEEKAIIRYGSISEN